MKKMFRRALLCALFALLLACVCSPVLAAPRNVYPSLYTQPDGGSFEATLEGDAGESWISVENGYALVRDSSGYWCYAMPDGDSYKPGSVYTPDSVPDGALTNAEMYALAPIEQGATGDELIEANSLSARGSMLGSKKTLVLLVDTNTASIRQTDSFWAQRIFATGGTAPNASVREYYRTISGNRIDLVPAAESKGTVNDGVVRVKVSMNHPGSSAYSCDTLVTKALSLANQYVDFASFDTDGNGRVLPDELHIVTIIGGYEASASSNNSPAVWAHYMQQSAGLVTCDRVRLAYGSVRVGEYMWSGTPLQIGTIAHELGHSMGLYDLYDTDYSSRGVGPHSLMGSGSWGNVSVAGDCPVYLDPFSRVYLGIASPTVVTSGSYQVNAASASNANILRVNTSKASEYFLIENRQFTGFDRGLEYYMSSSAKGGIAIWHIDESLYGRNCNDNEYHKAVDIEEANEGTLGYSQLDNGYTSGYNHYYSSSINTTFNSTSRPNSKLYSGAQSGVSVSVPGSSASTMTVTIGSGTQPTAAPTSGSGDPYEYNNSFSSATEIDSYGTLYATIYGQGDYDYYELDFGSARNVVITMTPPAGRDYDIYLYNSNHVEIANSRKASGATETINTYLSDSDYYLLVRGYNNAYSTQQYTLSIQPSGSPTGAPTNRPTATPTVRPTAVPTSGPLGDRYEPNNSIQQAFNITGPLYATIHNSTDVDFFRLYVSNSAQLKINMEPADDRDYDLYLYNATGVLQASSIRAGDRDEEISRYLPAGTYYIKVAGYRGACSADYYYLSYSLNGVTPSYRPTSAPTSAPTLSPSGDRYEPNNYISQAYAIGAGTLYATIHVPGDEDFYAFTLPSAATVGIEMEPADDRDYDLYLYNASGVRIAYSNRAGDNDETITGYLPAGRYYILVTGYRNAYDSAHEYELELQATLPIVTPTPTGAPTRTPVVTPTPASSTKYRALLIGNYNYSGNELDGPGNDVAAMARLLGQMDYNGTEFTAINRYTNLSKTGISNRIAQAAAAADSDDVTFFYFSGHGALSGGTAYLVGVDFSYISVDTLESWLSQIPGTVVVLLDNCHSGGFINKGQALEGEEEFDAARFSQSVIRTFSTPSASAARNYLTSGKYKVLTACAKRESSWEGWLYIDGTRTARGYFTYAIECAGEYGNAYMDADVNYDDRVSLQELYLYTYEMVNYIMDGDDETQTVQVYPANDSFTILAR